MAPDTLDRAPAQIRAAEQDGQVVGFSHGGSARDVDTGDRAGEVYTLYLLREVLGTGVGAALLAAVTDALRSARRPVVSSAGLDPG